MSLEWQLLGVFFSKLLAYLTRNYFPKRPSGAPLHTISKLYDVPVGFCSLPAPSIGAVCCFICGRRRVVVARYQMICLALDTELDHHRNTSGFH